MEGGIIVDEERGSGVGPSMVRPELMLDVELEPESLATLTGGYVG